MHFPLVLTNRLNKTETSVFLYCRFSLFLKGHFSRLFRGRTSCMSFCHVELVIFFSYSGHSGTLGSEVSRIPLKPVLGVVRIVALSISSHE